VCGDDENTFFSVPRATVRTFEAPSISVAPQRIHPQALDRPTAAGTRWTNHEAATANERRTVDHGRTSRETAMPPSRREELDLELERRRTLVATRRRSPQHDVLLLLLLAAGGNSYESPPPQ